MALETVQVRCPFCNGAQAARGSGQYTCDFCLQPFTAVDAQREERRLLDQVQGWLQQKVGALAGAAGVDASSRAFIFQQKVFPELRRDVDRALEQLGGHGQHPLVVPPLPTAAGPAGPSPFLDGRNHVGQLKELRARVGSEAVRAFAMAEADKAAIGELDQRVGEVLHLFHVTSGGHARTVAGYAAARRSLEALLEELAASMASVVAGQPGRREFLAAQQARFRGLCELSRVFEEALAATALSGEALAARLEAQAVELDRVAREIEQGTWNPAEAMPVLLAVQAEGAGARSMARWMRAYDALAHGRPVQFSAFLERAFPLVADAPGSADDVIGPWAEALRAARGEVAVPGLPDFAWADAWAESQRSKKSLGLFGKEERLTRLERLLVPCWLAELSYSQSQGAIFRSGGEARSFAIVEACNPSAAKVVIFPAGDATLAPALTTPRPLSGWAVALPRSGPSAAHASFAGALRQRTDLLNATAAVRGLIYLPAAYARFESKAGPRVAGSCLGGRVPVDGAALSQAQLAADLTGNFS